ncbi:hypothetical protein AAEO50_16485 [Rossellomorea oryzaecorticis]|uniref:Uncharacterized protein n=1 Tax=Rossellomorea oryzaecorticis TaxID=1396505 RepID=A0ABU9KE32_9BACI
MIGVEDEDSCGKSVLGETPQERMRRGGSPTARGKRSLPRKSTAVFKDNNNVDGKTHSIQLNKRLFNNKKSC